MLDTLGTADRIALHELYARSAMLLEAGQCADWIQLFQAQAKLECTAAPGQATLNLCGREALLTLAQRVVRGEVDLALGELAAPARYHHILNNLCLFHSGRSSATGLALLTVVTADGVEPPQIVASGTYSDTLVKCAASCWRFASRTLRLDGAAHLPARRIA